MSKSMQQYLCHCCNLDACFIYEKTKTMLPTAAFVLLSILCIHGGQRTYIKADKFSMTTLVDKSRTGLFILIISLFS